MNTQTKDYSLLYFALLLTFLIFTVKAVGQDAVILNHDTEIKANQLLKQHIDKKIFTGVVAGISIQNNHVWLNVAGHSNKVANKAMEAQTVVRTASIAKSMTAVAIMQLVEKGLIDLDVPIQTYIPDYPKKKEGDITTKQLLYQTAGIPNYASTREVQNDKNYPTLADAVDVFKNRDLLHQPGTAFSYATYNYVVLGLIIEKVSGLTYEAYMTKNIWEKAGMQQTGIEKYGQPHPNRTSLYHRNKKGKIKLAKKENDLSNRIPGGGFYSTVGDLLRFGEAIISNELISTESLQTMLTQSEVAKEGNPYGMGWFMYGGEANPSGCIGHSGAQTGVSSQLMIIPSTGTIVAILANTSGAWEEAIQLSVALIQLIKKT